MASRRVTIHAVSSLTLFLSMEVAFATSGIFLWQGDRRHWALCQIAALILFAGMLVYENWIQKEFP